MSKMWAIQTLAMVAAQGFQFPTEKSKYKPKEKKNKYKLSEEEIQQMSEMTPKEKKEFLKGRI